MLPKVVSPIAISEFRVLQQPEPESEPVQLFLAEQQPQQSSNAVGPVELNQSNGGSKANDGSVMSMNGLKFRKGLGVSAQSRMDYQLTGQWRLLRADVGIDDSCRDKGGVQFQIFGDDKLLYDSGLVQAPAVVKPELDIRGIRLLSLRTTGGKSGVCANWANASVLGYPAKNGML
ncbi:MAG: NPCBM/NEW2 domain-containing protein [Rheinheimera sp.]|nr:NPCBM/NEW2 domain-containing protein [Rheinheimera sp.]